MAPIRKVSLITQRIRDLLGSLLSYVQSTFLCEWWVCPHPYGTWHHLCLIVQSSENFYLPPDALNTHSISSAERSKARRLGAPWWVGWRARLRFLLEVWKEVGEGFISILKNHQGNFRGCSFCNKASCNQWDVFYETEFNENTELSKSLFPGSCQLPWNKPSGCDWFLPSKLTPTAISSEVLSSY
jgi:hypothetical protein